MLYGLYWLAIIRLFSFANKCEATEQSAQNGVPYILVDLFRNKPKPLIVYLNPRLMLRDNDKPNLKFLQYVVDNDDDYDNHPNLRTARNDERAYLLYNILRSALNNEDVDSSEGKRLQYTKKILRQALIGRCRKLNKCVEKCPEVKPSCTMKCKQIFDDLDACDEPKKKKCKEPKCGRTMPPYWRL